MPLKAAAATQCCCFGVVIFFYFNVLIRCQRQLCVSFAHEHTLMQPTTHTNTPVHSHNPGTLSHYSFINTPLSRLSSLSAILTCLSPTSSLVSPPSPLGEMPKLSCESAIPCRFELHPLFPILPLFKVTGSCVLRFPPICPLGTPQCLTHTSLQHRAHTSFTADQTAPYPYKLYQRIAGNKYEGDTLTNCHRVPQELPCKNTDTTMASACFWTHNMHA